MCPDSIILCPHLKGSPQGAICGVVNSFIKNIDDVEIRLCMSKRFEACHLYVRSLEKLTASPGTVAVAL
jgi:hypothetical protein